IPSRRCGMSEALPLPVLERRPSDATRWDTFVRALAGRGEDVRLALSALRGHKLRAGLTLLGIVIGVATVISVMSLLTGLRRYIDEGLGGLGANVFQIQK